MVQAYSRLRFSLASLHCTVYSAVNGVNLITELDNGTVDWPNTSSNRRLLSVPKSWAEVYVHIHTLVDNTCMYTRH